MIKLLLTVLLVYLFVPSIEACGPRRFVPIFYSRDGGQYGTENKHTSYGDITKPYVDFKGYIQGNLGVVRPQYGVFFLWIAYSNLTNKPFSSEEIDLLHKLHAEKNDSSQSTDWKSIWNDSCCVILQQRQKSISGFTSSRVQKGNNSELISFENCTDSAFQYALNRLEQIKKSHGEKSEILLQWVKSQQQVFENCDRSKTEVILPNNLQPTATPEQKNDYDYQVASSYFYAMDYEKSGKLFEEISNNSTSPYKDIALYLVFRSHFRNIIYKGASEKLFTEAYDRLKDTIEKAIYREDIKGLYHHIKLNDAAASAAFEIANELSNKFSGSLVHELRYHALTQGKLLEGDTKLDNEFWEWRRLFKSKNGCSQALAYWRETKSPLWLIVVLETIPCDSKDLEELTKAAEAIPETSPAYLTVTYQIARLYCLKGDKENATKVIDKILVQTNLSLSTKNRFLDLRAALTKNFSNFLNTILQEPVDEDRDNESYQNHFLPFLNEHHKDLTKDFDWEHFYEVQKVPVSSLKKASQSANIPQWLKSRLLIAAWVRSVLLTKMEDAKEIAHQLSETEPQLKESLNLFLSEQNPKRQHYIAHLLITRFPSFSILIYPNAWRNKAGGWRDCGLDHSKVDTKSGLRENWWKDGILKELTTTPLPSFLTQEEATNTEKEFKQLEENIPLKTNHFCQLAIQWFKEMPQDPLLPEMMHHCIQMSRHTYAPKSSYDVFKLIHKHFKDSKYAQKSRYHYWHKGVSETEGD